MIKTKTPRHWGGGIRQVSPPMLTSRLSNKRGGRTNGWKDYSRSRPKQCARIECSLLWYRRFNFGNYRKISKNNFTKFQRYRSMVFWNVSNSAINNTIFNRKYGSFLFSRSFFSKNSAVQFYPKRREYDYQERTRNSKLSLYKYFNSRLTLKGVA